MQVAVPPFLTIAEAATLIKTKQVSPVELTQSMLDRVEALNDTLHAFITITADLAMEQAKAAEAEIIRGQYRGPLHGIPMAHKDLYATKGVLTTAHSRVLEHWVPEEDCTPIARLNEAGAILLGKLATMEFATGSVIE